MNLKVRKVLSCLIVIVVIVGWFITVNGAGSIDSIKDVMKFGLDIDGGVYVVMEADTDATGSELSSLMEQTRAVLERRVNAMGISEATVSIEGSKRLRVEMTGVENADEAIQQIGKTAQLKFTLADDTPVLSGEDVKNAGVNTDSEHGGYLIELEFTSDGTTKFTEGTTTAYSGSVTSAHDGVSNNAIIIWLDDEIISAPVVSNGPITTSTCQITREGGFGHEEASNLAALIRGGALPVSLNEVTSSVQTATIGENALHSSVIAGLIGLALVCLIMLVGYGMLGLMADIALALYVLIELWFMAGVGVVLTLPGIAAIILSIGMAVDANVIIFSRIQEEISHGKTFRVAVSEGFGHAVYTVLDAQITTLIAAVVLYIVGSTTVKGFAITLMIGIIVSVFTAVVISQILITALAGSKRFAKNKYFGCSEDGTPKQIFKKQFDFIGKRKIFYTISAVAIVVGLICGAIRGFNYGIDFTGGTMIQIDMGQEVETSEVADEIKEFDLDPTIVLAGSDRHQVIIKTIKALDNDQRQQVIDALGDKYGVTSDDVLASEQFGPTVGKELRSNAVKSIIIAAICMLIYINVRFKSWKYGVSAVAGLVHDVLMILSIYGLFRIVINNPFIAGILTVVGYSINDTIVVFDRIRENRELYKKEDIKDVINQSINQTLNRSIMTSITTLVAMIPLLIMVSTTIRNFLIPLMLGVLVGTYSSIFLCSPILYEFNKNVGKSAYKLQLEKQAKEKEKGRSGNKGKN